MKVNLSKFGMNRLSDKPSNDEFISTLRLIKEGDNLLREEFLAKYTPFILKIASNFTGKYIDVNNSDEYSIVLSAFNEAIDCYDLTKNYNFLLFSEHVIKKRLIDHMRKDKGNKEIPFSYFEDETEFLEKYVSSVHDKSFEDIEQIDEIIEYKETLREFGISLEDLILNVPKHKDSRELCLKIASILANDEELFRQLYKYKNIPRNDLKRRAGVHGRTIGRHRKYIIAVCLILKSNLEISKSYLSIAEKGGKRGE
ncbi:RNA polymerase sigma-I factor [Acetivibrio clariflavus]|uniref:RNA polymerase sigma factor SigI n=1 Tax=Acetivibrio clariflavus (strain DSM 19732 / NBRC 101661 / EBR45) TaxID=720554 RepID=G8LST2_ACECE|nr:RNA polymerase sigma-I factor [Acetivibrio clariflavus]AEV70445.1 RNA polymerase sigma-I factor [Acetivibrio clariflavus DSM 19732]